MGHLTDDAFFKSVQLSIRGPFHEKNLTIGALTEEFLNLLRYSTLKLTGLAYSYNFAVVKPWSFSVAP